MDETNVIALTKGKFATVSAEDFERVSAFKWCVSHGYAARGVTKNGKHTTESMHRFILQLSDGHVDHRDGNGFNNTRENLHISTIAVNVHRRHVTLSSTGRRGVFKQRYYANKYFASIKDNYKTKYLGLFDSVEAAAQAYDLAALELHGENAMTNFKWQKTRAEGWKRLL